MNSRYFLIFTLIVLLCNFTNLNFSCENDSECYNAPLLHQRMGHVFMGVMEIMIVLLILLIPRTRNVIRRHLPGHVLAEMKPFVQKVYVSTDIVSFPAKKMKNALIIMEQDMYAQLFNQRRGHAFMHAIMEIIVLAIIAIKRNLLTGYVLAEVNVMDQENVIMDIVSFDIGSQTQSALAYQLIKFVKYADGNASLRLLGCFISFFISVTHYMSVISSAFLRRDSSDEDLSSQIRFN
ncbi:hypothetical protein Glove_243g42 [Diversispora epigaea]|uniref:Abscisic acid G-protein coupled receptor-like domain-containing protein n=1 Tax=Diversispora epigaea TaxID=1348612 RepID=A0A397IEP7_9GLOM|nr:hypothetical protein Glove_243g42 [Diversispora epigaea]